VLLVLGECPHDRVIRVTIITFFVQKAAWVHVLFGLSAETDYDNFKGAVVRHQSRGVRACPPRSLIGYAHAAEVGNGGDQRMGLSDTSDMASQRPNLFNFATSELSQDAFICWLASWARPAHKRTDPALHETAICFLNQLLEAGKQPAINDIRSIDIYRQWNDIDVLIVVNGETPIIIEDKIGSNEHSNQLELYRRAVARKFPQPKIAAVYLKTGDQSSFDRVVEAGYGKFLREDFLKVLDRGERKEVKNDIFADFHARLKEVEAAVKSYQHLPLAKWRSDTWRGFYIALQQRLPDAQWGTKNGPDLCFWWHWRNSALIGATTFLRLRRGELCFRIEVVEQSQQKVKRGQWQNALIHHMSDCGITLKRKHGPPGKGMTAAVFDGDYRHGTDDGRLDFEVTLQKLKDAELLVDTALGRV
jgi:hypothetical protein